MADKREAISVTFWGVRGSYPVPGRSTVLYGGNTTCHEVRAGGRTIILDAGSGIIGLGRKLVRETVRPLNLAILFSHSHHDHTSGILYFKPAYLKSTRAHIFGPTDAQGGIDAALYDLALPALHPVSLEAMGMHYTCKDIGDGSTLVWRPGCDDPELVSDAVRSPQDVVVRVMFNPCHATHGSLNFRIEHMGASYVYATDVEGDEEKGDPRLIEFARGADLLAHDAQYDSREYFALRRGWGHSTYAMAMATAEKAGVKRLAFIHHEPMYSDAKLARIEKSVKKRFANAFMAREGRTIRLYAATRRANVGKSPTGGGRGVSSR